MLRVDWKLIYESSVHPAPQPLTIERLRAFRKMFNENALTHI